MDKSGNYKNLFLCIRTAKEKSDYMNEVAVTFDDFNLLIRRYSKWVRRMISNHEVDCFEKDFDSLLARIRSKFRKKEVVLSEAWGIVLQSMLQEIGVEGINTVTLEDIIGKVEPQRFITETLLHPLSAKELESTLNAGNVLFKNMFGKAYEEDSVIVVKSDDNFVVHHPPLRFLFCGRQSHKVLYTLEPHSIEYFGNKEVRIITSQETAYSLETLQGHILGLLGKGATVYKDTNVDLVVLGRGAFLISQLLLAGNIISYPWYFTNNIMDVKAVSLIERWRETNNGEKVEVGEFYEHVFPLHSVDPERFIADTRLSPTGSTILECVRFEPARRLVQFQVPFLRIDAEDQELFTQMTKHYFYSRQALSSYKSRSGAIRNDLCQWITNKTPSKVLRQMLQDLEDGVGEKSTYSVTGVFSQVVIYRLLVSDLLELPTSYGGDCRYDVAGLCDSISSLLRLTKCIKKSDSVRLLKQLSSVSLTSLETFLNSAEVCCTTSFEQFTQSLVACMGERDVAYGKVEKALRDLIQSKQDLEIILQDLMDISPYPLQNGLIKRITGGTPKVLGNKVYSCKTLEKRLTVLMGLLSKAYPHFTSCQTQEKIAIASAILSWIDTERDLWSVQSEIVRPFAKCRDSLDCLMAELIEYLCYLALGPLRSNLFLLWSLFGSDTMDVVRDIIQRRGNSPVIVRKIRKDEL